MRARSLKWTFLFALIGLVVVQSLIFGGIAAYRLTFELDEQFRDRAVALTQHIAQEAFYAAFLQGGAGLNAMVKGLVDENVLYVQIVIEGRVAAQENPKALELPLGRVPAEVDLQRKTFEGVAYLDVTRALLGRPQDAAQDSYVRLGISLEYVQQELRQELAILAGAAGIMALLGTGVAFALYRLILTPLDRLRACVRRFGQGQFAERARLSRWDELAELAGEFNAMADAIAAMKEQLERDSRAKSEFLTVVGHELRTPLHGLLGYAELLEERIGGPLTEKQEHQLRALRSAGEHLQSLVESTLRYAKLEMGQERVRCDTVQADAVVAEAVAALQPLAAAKGLALSVRAPALTLRADRTKLKQILLNLLHNAVQHSQRGTIELEVRAQSDNVCFEVRDQGPGITPQDQAKVFEPFAQLESVDRRASKGLGLGLAIVKRYTEMHGGTVSLQSTPNRGSCFTVCLPREGSKEVRVEGAGR